ncbi:MAG: polyprenol monophosphomannose synthase [Pirellulaceae bacterium]|jgi:dolichol-phosphate mannosyltransferase
MTMREIVLLCTYNEAENLPELFDQLGEHLPNADILVVDDNSPDGTADWVRRQDNYCAAPDADRSSSSIYLLLRSGKYGLGTATRDGLQWCLDRSYDFIVNLDADLSHAPQYAPQLVATCLDERVPCDVAVGSRYVAGGSLEGLPLHRRWMSRLLNGYATWMLGLPVKDCSGSYRCYRVDALRRLELNRLTCPGYGFLEELLVALHRDGARLVEVPIEFRERAGGNSKLGWSDAWGAVRVIHRLAFMSSPK